MFSHTTTETKHQMKSRLLLDVVIRQSTTIFQLLASEDESLLVRGNSFLVLDLGLHVVNGVRALHLKSDCLTSKSLHEDLHTSSQAKNQVQGGLLLDVVVRQGATILQLLAGEDQPLLVWRNTFLVLDLRLHVVNSVRALHL
jgi:hypothetical protein